MRTTFKSVWVVFFLCWPGILVAGSVLDSPHNLSVSGPGTVTAVSEDRVCEFCHTPHSSSTTAALWNRNMTIASFVPYTSSTAVAQPGQPTGDSLLCLSCHDGTIALGEVLSRADVIAMSGGNVTMPSGPGLIGTDLRFDHPVSIEYTAALAAQNGELEAPGTLSPAVKLDASGQLQCTTCHDAHDNDLGNFLVMSNVGSQLCTECHAETGWFQTSHNLSPATWNGQQANPWPDSGLVTVGDNACRNCHESHSAAGGPRLLRSASEEDNCSACHNGNVAAENVMGRFNLFSSHPIGDTTLVHDPVEPAIVDVRHVECADCHDPHATQAGRAAGDTPANVRGVSLAGNETSAASRTYEICLRCHGDSPDLPIARTSRQIEQSNMRLLIQLDNPSFHPIAGAGRNLDVPSLIQPLTEQSVIGCTDCHNSNDAVSVGGTGPEGPHGSNFEPILSRNYITLDNTPESASSYALCYSCHSRTNILNDVSFGDHDKHIRGEDTPCNACHDPHGVDGALGNDVNNSHLINFDTSIVSPNQNGDLRFVDGGDRTGSCDLECHGKDHDNESY